MNVPAAPSEWAANRRMLLAAIVSIPVPAAMSYQLGQFMGPLEQEFGWTRAEASIGYSISLLLGFFTGPLIGRLVDRTNARRLALTGIILTGLAMASFSLATSSLGLWIGLWCLVSLVGGLAGPTVWLAVVSAAFQKNRSLAISMTLCGMSLASTLAPLASRLLIDAYGWRTAWVLLGLVWSGPALVLTLLFFFDHRPANRRAPDKIVPDSRTAAPKPLLRLVFLSGTFIRLALAVVTIGMAGSSFALHLAPALMDKGMNATTAAAIAGIFGLTAIVGRLFLGWIFDRAPQAAVTTGVMALYALAGAILAQDSVSVPLAVAGCVVLGLASGALSVVIACLAARLFDSSMFGVIYGSLTSLAVLAAAVGPLLVSRIHDATGSYTIAFWSGGAIAVVAALLLLRLTPVGEPEMAATPLASAT